MAMSDIKNTRIVETTTARFEDRTLAWLVDAAIGYGAVLALWFLLTNAIAFVPLLYVLFRDALFRGQSIGKRLFGVRVIDAETGRPCTVQASVVRNLPLAAVIPIPVELFIAALSPEGLRLGDYFARTRVTEVEHEEGGESEPEPEPGAGELRAARQPTMQKVEPEPTATSELIAVAEYTESLNDITGERIDSILDFGGEDEHAQPAAAEEEDEGTDLDDILEFDEGADTAASAPAEPKGEADPYMALNVPKNADRDSVEDAYWAFVDRFSDEEIRELDTEDLDQRCRELAERFQHLNLAKLGVKLDYSRKMSDKAKRDFIHQHVVAINRARDSLLR